MSLPHETVYASCILLNNSYTLCIHPHFAYMPRSMHSQPKHLMEIHFQILFNGFPYLLLDFSWWHMMEE